MEITVSCSPILYSMILTVLLSRSLADAFIHSFSKLVLAGGLLLPKAGNQFNVYADLLSFMTTLPLSHFAGGFIRSDLKVTSDPILRRPLRTGRRLGRRWRCCSQPFSENRSSNTTSHSVLLSLGSSAIHTPSVKLSRKSKDTRRHTETPPFIVRCH